MTAPQDAPAGPVLGDEELETIASALWGMERAGDPDPKGQARERARRAIDALDPHIAALLSSAREEGAVAERERIARCAVSEPARRLVEQALHLCQHGERAPGVAPWPAETWPEWARRAEEWLRAEPAREPVDVAGLVTAEMVRRASDAGYRGVPLTRPILRPPDEFMRAALLSVAADLYERDREDGRGDLIWHEERVRRECAAELRLRVRRLTSALIAVSNHLDQPYPDDPRWTPWTRFVKPEVDALRVLVDRWSADQENDT